MKSYKLKAISISFCLLFLFSSCQKDEEGFIPNQDSELEQEVVITDIFGVVSSENNEPIAGAIVTYRGETTESDEEGIYTFKQVVVGSQHNSVKIVKDGYFENARTFRSLSMSIQYQRTILQEKLFEHVFQSTENSMVDSDIAQINFPANSIVIESTGASYNGEVQVAVQEIDPTINQLSETMPGDMTAVGPDNTLLTLQSFGMVNVELQTPNGIKLQRGPDASAELSYKIHQNLLGNAPVSIDMWSFDYDLGSWLKEGEASLIEGRYVGLVSHFSCWNFDVSAPSVVVTGKVVSDEFNLGFYNISILNTDNKGGRGWTDAEGYFSGRVEAGVELTLRIDTNLDCFMGNTIYTQTLGPFDVDTDLGTINVDISGIELLILKTTAVDCNFNPVLDGRVSVGGHKVPFSDGIIDLSFPICSPVVADITVIDAINLMQSYITDVEMPGKPDIPRVIVCGEVVDHILLDNVITSPINVIDSLDIFSYNNQAGDAIAILYGLGSDASATMSFKKGFASSDPQLEEKTYSLISFSSSALNELGEPVQHFYMDESISQEGTVSIETIIQGVGNFKVATGLFSAECTEEITGEIKTITGSFKLHYRE